MPEIKTSAEKREHYLWAAIHILQASDEIFAAESDGDRYQMPEGKSSEIVEELYYLLHFVAEQTGLTVEGLRQKHEAILRQLGEEAG